MAHLRPQLSNASTPQEVAHTARMLGRLYDAVECQGINAALVRRIGADAGVPVYDGIATATHSTAGMADQLAGAGDALDKRRFVVQALLLSSLV